MGENTIQRLKRRSQSTQGTIDAPDASTPLNSSPRLKNPYRYLVTRVEVAVEAFNLDHSR